MSFRLDLRLPARGLRFALESGSPRVTVRGPSGVGKTTLLRALAGLEPGALGRCEALGRCLQDEARSLPPRERRVGWVPQDSLLFPHADVLGNLRWGGGSEAEAREVAEALGLTPLLGRRPRALSGGERQRVALGRAVLSGPALLLLDEPFSALDAASRGLAVALLRARGLPMVLVTHADEPSLEGEVWEMRDGGELVRVG